MEVTLTSKSQLTLPAEIRKKLGLGPGDRLNFELHDDGHIEVRPVPRKTGSIEDLIGCLPWSGPPKTLEEMERGIEEGASERFLRAVAKDA